MVLDLIENSPPQKKIPTPIIIVKNIYLLFIFIFQKSRTPPIEKKFTHIVYYGTNKQLEKMRIDPKFVELTVDALKIFL